LRTGTHINLIAFFIDSSSGVIDKKFVSYLETAPRQLVSTFEEYQTITVSGIIYFYDNSTSSKTVFADHD
jgi:hypothetical protein